MILVHHGLHMVIGQFVHKHVMVVEDQGQGFASTEMLEALAAEDLLEWRNTAMDNHAHIGLCGCTGHHVLKDVVVVAAVEAGSV